MRLIDVHNPLIPAPYDVFWAITAIVVLVATVLAVASIWRARAALTTIQTTMWILLSLFVPVVGAAAWFLFGRLPADRTVPTHQS